MMDRGGEIDEYSIPRVEVRSRLLDEKRARHSKCK
jgi:hypothetical protein